MNTFLRIAGTFVLACSASTSFAQPNPAITGDTLLCPEGTGTLMCTEPYESYQWYQRFYGSSFTDTVLIPGATSQTLDMNYYDYAASYLIVEVTENGDTVMSPEFFVDGLVFFGITVMSTGDFTVGNNFEAILCDGDTMYFELMEPYNTSVTWYVDGDTIPGENTSMLTVTEAGSYTVSAAPDLCPNPIQYLGLYLDVAVENCSAAGLDENGFRKATIFPNPATDQLTIEHTSETIKKIEIRNTAGQLVRVTTTNQLSVTVPVDNLRKGTYFVTVHYSDRNEVVPVTIQ
jgi:hypothetical protein